MAAPPSRGLAGLRDALAGELRRSTGRAVDPDAEILVTNGAMHALALCFRSLVRPGDEVVVPAPCFFFEGPIRAAGATPVYVHGSPVGRVALGSRGARGARSDHGRARCSSATPGTRRATFPRSEEVADAVRVAERARPAGRDRRGVRGGALGRSDAHVGVRPDRRRRGRSQPRQEPVVAAAPAWNRFRPVGAHRRVCARRSSGTACASTSPPRPPRSPCSRGRGSGWTTSTPGSSPTAPPRSRPSRRHRASWRPCPRRRRFLFVHAASGEAVADALARAGVPVVDGVHFQAPGYARLPFGGAARAEEALVAALARWATGPAH